jgi:hypothetical protein
MERMSAHASDPPPDRGAFERALVTRLAVFQYRFPGQTGEYDLISSGPDGNSPIIEGAGGTGASAAVLR